MIDQPQDVYLSLMQTIRNRFDFSFRLKQSENDEFLKAEISAFNGRKIIEGIAFGCLVALENSIKYVPKDTKGQWNAQEILKSLEKKKFDAAFPSPSIIRNATEAEYMQYGAKVTVEGQADRRLSTEGMIAMYIRMHRWAHEINPYTEKGGRSKFFEKHEAQLWQDLDQLWRFIEKHVISFKGKAFFCILKDNLDDLVKISSLSKIVEK